MDKHSEIAFFFFFKSIYCDWKEKLVLGEDKCNYEICLRRFIMFLAELNVSPQILFLRLSE